jgi:hypothetical protein
MRNITDEISSRDYGSSPAAGHVCNKDCRMQPRINKLFRELLLQHHPAEIAEAERLGDLLSRPVSDDDERLLNGMLWRFWMK